MTKQGAQKPMRDSGVEWLGEVPAHWRVLRFKLSTKSCQNGIWGAEPNGDEDDLECVRVADFNRSALVVSGVVPTIRAISMKEREGRLLRRGDLLLEKSGGGENQPVGQVVLYSRDEPAVCSNFVARVELRDQMEPRFWNYQHHAAYSARINVRSIKQTSGIQNLDHHQYLDELAAFPPFEEQTSISDYLDRATTRIDALVAKKTRFIELLREKRQALITRAVTRGLDPAVPMKDSGVEWLGRAPAHWTFPKLRHIATVQTGLALGKHLSGPDVISVPYLRVANVQDGYLQLDDVSTVSIRAADLPRYRLQSGDVLMNEGGDNDKLGRGHIWSGEIDDCVHQNHVFAIRPHGVTSRWLSLFKGSTPAQAFFTFRSKQTTNLASISSSNLLDLPVPRPPADEQAAIVEFVEATTTRIDTLIAKTERSIELLREKRSALITAAVTGKLDLRKAA